MELLPYNDDGDVMVMRAGEEINADNAHQLNEELGQRIDGGLRRLIVDCSGLDAMNSMGISTLLLLHNRMNSRGGVLRISGTRGQVADVLRMTRLDVVLRIHPDIEQANQAFSD